MSMMDKLRKNSKIKETAILSESHFFDENFTNLDIPAMNIALSGDLKKGFTSGLTVIAGPSKHFKTSFALVMASAYLKKYDDAVLLFYDTEFGSPLTYFENFNIDLNRVLHTPIQDIEILKFDLINQLEKIDSEKDHVIIIIDSIGNIASKKELEDTLKEKSVADMSRAKALKGLFRMVTPYLKMKKIPLLAVNHVYQEMGLFPKSIVSGGTGIYYAADTIWIVGRQQDKKNNEILGYNFVIRVEKSRFVKEGSKIPITVSWEHGILKYSGLLDIVIAGKFIHHIPNTGWYQYMDSETGELIESKMRFKDIDWEKILTNENFQNFINKQYQVGMKSPVDMDEITREEEK